MLESLFNTVAGLQVLSYKCCEIFKSSFFCKTPAVTASAEILFCIVFSKRRCWIYCSYALHNCYTLHNWNLKSLSFTFIRFHSLCRTLSFVLPLVVIRCHSLSFTVTRCNSLSLVVPFVATRCTTRWNSLSFVLPRVVTRCHSLSFFVTRCTTRKSFYKRSFSNSTFWLWFIW